MGKISESIRKIYGLKEKDSNDFIKKYDLEDFTLDVKSIKSWEEVPEKVAYAFKQEFDSDIELLHQYFQSNLPMKELSETYNEINDVKPDVHIDEIISMLISLADDYFPDSQENTTDIILTKGNTSISAQEVMDIFNVNYYNDLRMNALSYAMFGVNVDEEITMPTESMPNFVKIISQLTNRCFDVDHGEVLFILSADPDNEEVKIMPRFTFTCDDKFDEVSFNGAEAVLFFENTLAVAQNFQIVVKATSNCSTMEVYDKETKTKDVPVEYMGTWHYTSGQFAGVGSEFTSMLDATDFENNGELKVVDEQVRYITTSPFIDNEIDLGDDFDGYDDDDGTDY